jgi:hypothetical protein
VSRRRGTNPTKHIDWCDLPMTPPVPVMELIRRAEREAADRARVVVDVTALAKKWGARVRA